MISQRAKSLKPSPTLAMATRAKELQSKGHDVISLTVGEPDWPTFAPAAEAGIEAIRQGFTKYTPAHGILELRETIAKQAASQLGVNYKASDVAVGPGAKYILYTGLQLLVNPDDEVVIPSPYWVSYPTMVELASGRPRIIECTKEENFKLSPEKLRASLSKKTKVLMVCSPSNPTGLQYSRDEWKALATVLLEFPDVFVISDDIYGHLTFSGEALAPHLLQAAPELKERVLAVSGASKTYSMTGWRVGWGLGPTWLMQPMADFLSQTTSSLSSISQMAALAALQKCESDVIEAREKLKQKRDFFFKELSAVKGFSPVKPDGAFYLWVDVAAFFGRRHHASGKMISNSKDIAEILLENHLLASVPGVEFGVEGFLRFSFTVSQVQLAVAIERLRTFSNQVS